MVSASEVSGARAVGQVREPPASRRTAVNRGVAYPGSPKSNQRRRRPVSATTRRTLLVAARYGHRVGRERCHYALVPVWAVGESNGAPGRLVALYADEGAVFEHSAANDTDACRRRPRLRPLPYPLGVGGYHAHATRTDGRPGRDVVILVKVDAARVMDIHDIAHTPLLARRTLA